MSSLRRASGNDSVMVMVFAQIENARSFSSATLTLARRCGELMVAEMLRLIAAIRAGGQKGGYLAEYVSLQPSLQSHDHNVRLDQRLRQSPFSAALSDQAG